MILDNIIYYPVGTSDQILGLVSVYKINVDIEYCVSDWLVDEMNRYHFLDGGYQVVIDYPDDDSRPGVHFISAGRDIDIYNDEPEQSVQMRDDPYVNYLSSFQAFVFPTQGFYINLPTYKKLNMDYCLVTQGADRCGAACVSTIYRYRTATAVLNDILATDVNTYVLSGAYPMSTTAGQAGVLNYLLYTPDLNSRYKVKSFATEGLLSQFDVQHNINNSFPLIYGGTNTTTLGVHAFVLFGYEMSGTMMRYYFFNPWGTHSVTEYKSDGSAHSMSTNGYTWIESGNSCLLKP